MKTLRRPAAAVTACLLVALSLGPISLTGCRSVPDTPIRGEPQGRVVLIRGLMDVFSLGINDVADTLRGEGYQAVAISGARRGGEGRDIIDDHQNHELVRPLVIVGHSYGGDEAVRLTRQLDDAGVTVDKLILVDPTTPGRIPANVIEVFNIYRSSPATDWIPVIRGVAVEGEGEADQPATRIVNFDLRRADDPELSKPTINHFNIDTDPAVRALVVEQVQATDAARDARLAGPPADPESNPAPTPAPTGDETTRHLLIDRSDEADDDAEAGGASRTGAEPPATDDEHDA